MGGWGLGEAERDLACGWGAGGVRGVGGFAEAECGLTLLYEMGEVARLDQVKQKVRYKGPLPCRAASCSRTRSR